MKNIKIKYRKFNESQKDDLLNVIKKISKESEAKDKLASKKLRWEWQYKKLPSKKTFIYVAMYETKVIGYMHFPVYEFHIGKKSIKVASKQAVGVLSKFNGLGIFKNLSNFANKDLTNKVDFIYTFPNKKAIHTYLKYNNYRKVMTLPIYMKIISAENILLKKLNLFGLQKIIGVILDNLLTIFNKKLFNNESIVKLNLSKSSHCEIFNENSKKYYFSINKTHKYIRWRYNESYKTKYYIYGLKQNENIIASIIFREQEIMGLNGLVIMEYTYSNNFKDLMRLISNIPKILHEIPYKQKITFVLLSGTQLSLIKNLLSGYFYIPKKFSPRPLIYLYKKANAKKWINEKFYDKILVTLGDWDVF